MSNPNPSPKRTACTECGALCRARSGLCAPCRGFGNPIVLTGGHWVAVNGVQRYVQWTEEECIERAKRARELLRRQRLAALTAERYAEPTWWKRPDVLPASPAVAGERIAAMTADFEQADHRQRPTKEVA